MKSDLTRLNVFCVRVGGVSFEHVYLALVLVIEQREQV